MKRYVIFICIVLLALTAVLVFGQLGSSGRDELTSDGYLTVNTDTTDQIVLVSGEVIGKTPINRYKLKPGEFILRIGDYWQEKINVDQDKETIVGRTVTNIKDFSSGYSIGYEAQRQSFFKNKSLRVSSSPMNSSVQIDSGGIYTTPMELEYLEPGRHQAIISKKGYASEVVEFEAYLDTKVIIKADLRPNLIDNMEKLEYSKNDLMTNYPQKDVLKRSEWGGLYDNLRNYPLVISRWRNLEVWGGISDDVKNYSEWLVKLDGYIRESRRIIGIPFAYVIDEQGNIYEGLGIFDFDFSTLSGFNYTNGTLPVLVLARDSVNYKDQKIRESVSFLREYLNRVPRVETKNLNQLNQIDLTFGERRDLVLRWQNTSSFVWKKGTSYELYLKLDGNQKSVVYDPETWKEQNKVVGFTEQEIYPGEVATFEFKIKAPYYRATVEEAFALEGTTDDIQIKDSAMHLKVEVTGETDKVLEVLSTPTGFLNVRSGPTLSSHLITTIYPGDKFGYTKEENKWMEIILNDGTRGWITTEYIHRL